MGVIPNMFFLVNIKERLLLDMWFLKMLLKCLEFQHERKVSDCIWIIILLKFGVKLMEK